MVLEKRTADKCNLSAFPNGKGNLHILLAGKNFNFSFL